MLIDDNVRSGPSETLSGERSTAILSIALYAQLVASVLTSRSVYAPPLTGLSLVMFLRTTRCVGRGVELAGATPLRATDAAVRGLRRTVRRASDVVLLVVLGCAGAGDREMSSGPTVLEPSDVRIVGTSESLADVRDLEVLPDNSIWVLNSLEPFFVGFRQDGSLIGAHGSAGGGPEEFGLPSAFVAGGIGGSAWVLDLRRHALIRVPEPGGPRAEFSLPRTSIPPGSVRGGMDMLSSSVRAARLGDQVVVPRTSMTTWEDAGIYAYRLAILGADLVAVDTESGAARDVVSLREALSDPAAGFELTEGGFPLWYRLWAVCDDRTIRAYDRGANIVRGFTSAGLEVEPIPLPPIAFSEVTPGQFVRAMFGLAEAEAAGAVGTRLTAADSTRLTNGLLQRATGTPEELANYLPRYVDMRCGAGGALWIQPFNLELGRGDSLWLQLVPGGTVREFHLPRRFDAYRFTEGRIWGVQRDEFDVASVAWIQFASSPQ